MANCIDPNYIKLIVQSVILDMITNHQLQGALTDCDGGWVGADTKVVLCNTLADIIEQYFNDGSLNIHPIKSFELDGTTLNLTAMDDHEFSVDLSGLADEIGSTVVQAALKNCEGNPLSPGTQLMSCAEVNSAIATAVSDAVDSLKCMILDRVHTDDSMTGLGTCDSPLGVDPDWLNDHLAIQHDDSLTGEGTEEAPLAINVHHDDSMTGTGTSDDPLVVDETWLQQFLTDNDPDVDVLECPSDPTQANDTSLPTMMVGAPGAEATDIRAAILAAPDKFLKVQFPNKCEGGSGKLTYYIPLYAVPSEG